MPTSLRLLASTGLLALTLLGLTACPPPTMRTTPLEAALTALPPTMPIAPTHRGAIDLAAGVSGQSYLGRTATRPSGLSQYVLPYTGALALGGRFSRFVGARLIGELGLGGERVDAYAHDLLRSGQAGRLGGMLDIGYRSDDRAFHANLSIEAGIHVVARHRLFQIDSRTCSGLTEDTCTPWTPTSFPILSGTELLAYGRVTALIGYTIAPALRVLAQGSVASSPRLEGSAAEPTISQAPVVGVEGGLEVSYDAASLLVTVGWSSADVFEYGPRVSAALRAHLGDGPGSEERRRAARCLERERALQRERQREPDRAFSPREDPATAYGRAPATSGDEVEGPCGAPE